MNTMIIIIIITIIIIILMIIIKMIKMIIIIITIIIMITIILLLCDYHLLFSFRTLIEVFGTLSLPVILSGVRPLELIPPELMPIQMTI